MPPQALPQPPAQPASGRSHPPSQADPFQASSTSSTIPPSVPKPAPVDQHECLRSFLHEQLSRLALSLMASSNQVSAPATMPPQQFQPEVPVNSAVGLQGTYPQPNFNMASQEYNPTMEHLSFTSLQSCNSHQHPSSSSNQLPATSWDSGLSTGMFPTTNTPSTTFTFPQFNPSPQFNPNISSRPQLSVPLFRWMPPPSLAQCVKRLRGESS